MTRFLPVVILMCGAALPSWAQETARVPATVTTLGEAVVRMPADRALITAASETRAETALEAQNLGNAAMKAIQAAVEGLKLTGGQFSTTGMYLSPDYNVDAGKRTQRGYIGRHSITIRFDDVGRAGDVISAAVGAGANNVSGVRFDRRDRQALELQALKLAVQAARERADALAAGAGLVVDHIVRIADEQAASLERGPMLNVREAVMMDTSAPGAPVVSGLVEVRARVVLTVAVR